MVNLDNSELEDFTAAVKPKGIMLCTGANGEEERIIKRVEKWV